MTARTLAIVGAGLAGAKAALANCRRADLPPSGMKHDEMLKG